MNTVTIVLIVILAVLIIAAVVLYILGKRAEKKQADQQEKLDAVAQTVSLLVIDKGRVRFKDAGFPQVVIDATPKYLRRSKVNVVKAKIGPQIMNLMSAPEVFPLIPVKKEIKATISGIYITKIRGIHGNLEQPTGKKRFVDKLRDKANAYRNK
ncbi:MAG: hypothetical protein LBM02_01455 [Lachnospiraceae bacterium]|jgi:hypothetical protein|nr:hypothetical protein [Lachnospiraceae bacterium]